MAFRPFLILLLILAALPACCAPPPTVPRFAKFEASWTLPGQTGNPFDPADNDVRVRFLGPDRSDISVPAFWDVLPGQCGSELWRICA